MPAPLIWLGAGLAAAFVADKVEKGHRQSLERVPYYPGESNLAVKPQNGALVCCGIYGAFEHTGIWVDGDIVELKGNGLIRGISPERFLHNRSGDFISILCNEQGQPLVSPHSTERAVDKLFEYSDYHLLNNNCHRFSWYCVSGNDQRVSTFHQLNHNLTEYYKTPLHWHLLDTY